MKTINNFIVEHLKYSTFSINEKLKISSKSQTYNYFPKDKFELRKILEERLAEDKNANLNDIDVSQITDMGYNGFALRKGLFEGLDPHNIDISLWDVSNVTDMVAMFFGCNNLNCDLSKWDVSKVETMSYMFYECRKFNCDLNNWNVSKVTVMYSLFKYCENFNSDLGKWNVSNVKDMEYMFYNCTAFEGKNLENWQVNPEAATSSIFYKCTSLKNKPDWYKAY